MDPIPTFGIDDDGLWFAHRCGTEASDEDAAFRESLSRRAGGWQVTQSDPLTVTPSIHCTACGTHGFITNGVWVGV